MSIFPKGFHNLACGQAIISLKLEQLSNIFHCSLNDMFLIRQLCFYELEKEEAKSKGQIRLFKVLIIQVSALYRNGV